MANITKLLVMAFGLIALYAVSVVAECGTAKSRLTNVIVGTPFNIKLSEGQDCIKPESYDQISLLLNGMDTGIHPLGCDPVTKEMTFTIEKKEGSEPLVNNAVWKVILGQPWNSVQTNFQRELRYTITQSAESAEVKILGSGILKLLLLSTGYSLIGIVLVATLWGVLIYLGCKSGMLRDEGNQGSTLRDRTFSLGRVQMAWWFGIVMGSYIFLWVISHDIPPLGSQALLLMGISGGVGLTSAGLSVGMKKPLPISNGKFFDDLLTDAYGVTLHRLQMLAITVILGVMFIIHVITTLTMPEFNGSLLTLMGIAGGAYVGFKVPEKP